MTPYGSLSKHFQQLNYLSEILHRC